MVVADQTEDADATAGGEVQAVVRLLRARGRPVELHRNLPRRGLAQQRQFLLDRARAAYALFLDDDVICEPDLLDRLLAAIRRERCGFVGSPLVGLSYLGDVRPAEHAIEPWTTAVTPETLRPGDAAWARHRLHNAANPWHVAERLGLGREDLLAYRVAWVGGCVLYDVGKLRSVGGFSFWPDLPAEHCGEDVLAQQRVMARYGGCGLLPSGAYHQELPTTIPNRSCDAPHVLDRRPTAAGFVPPYLAGSPTSSQPEEVCHGEG